MFHQCNVQCCDQNCCDGKPSLWRWVENSASLYDVQIGKLFLHALHILFLARGVVSHLLLNFLPQLRL